MMHKLIYKFGVYFRNSKIDTHFKALLQSDKADINTLHQIQEERLKNLLQYAIENSSYYKEKFKAIDIDKISLHNITALPTLSKQELRDNLSDIAITMNEKTFLSSTSGSTGNALVFHRNKDWDASHRAAQLRGYSWFGINPWDKNLYFWGFNPSFFKKIKTRIMDSLVNRYRIFNLDDKSIDDAKSIIRKSRYIEGYSSSIFTLSQYFEANKVSFDNIKLVKGTSEKIFDSYQKSVKTVFGQKIVSEYGAAETGIIAFECPEGNMHISMENVIVEEVDNKILVTNLFSYSLPIIRYELGDYISLNKQKKCACGRTHEIIDEVTGRIGENIQGNNKSYFSLTLYYVFKNISLEKGIDLAYFASQHQRGEMQIQIVKPAYDLDKTLVFIYEELEKYFADDLEVVVKFVDKIDKKDKKAQSFVSYIDKKAKK